VTLVFSSIAGAVTGVIVLAARRGSMKYALPYGTFLAIAAIVSSLYGDQIVGWYAGLYR
jgi:leader peptidase (prepilin peptidase)/N-methyltransferase